MIKSKHYKIGNFTTFGNRSNGDGKNGYCGGRKQEVFPIASGGAQGTKFCGDSHGRPVAKLGPIEEHGKMEIGAREALFTRLKRQPVKRIGRWTREELYQDPQ